MIEPLFWNKNSSIERLAAVLRNGGIAIGASDTVFGLIVKLKSSSKEALDRIKKRVDKPYLILIPRNAQLGKFVDPSSLARIEELARACWPGPVTLICKARADLPDFMKGPEGTIALRMPNHEGLQKLLTHFEGLFSTSANISGQPVPENLEEVDPAVLAQCGAIILDAPGAASEAKLPSTILDCTGDDIKVIRQGAFKYPMKKM